MARRVESAEALSALGASFREATTPAALIAKRGEYGTISKD